MKPLFENQFTTGHALPDDYLGVAVDFRRRREQSYEPFELSRDPFDTPESEIARVNEERKQRVPVIGRGVVTFALAETHAVNEFNPIGCFHAYVTGRRRKEQQNGQVVIDGLWLDPNFTDSGLSLCMAEVGLEVFRSDRVITNADIVMPLLLSGALDSGDGRATYPLPARNPETIEEARLAINAVLAPSEPHVIASTSQLVTASI